MNATAVCERNETGLETLPLIRREGIEWEGGLGNEPLELRLTFENHGPAPTAPVPAQVRIAAFGAFLPWRPLTTVTVPAIPPRRRTVVTARATPSPRRSPFDQILDRAARRGQLGKALEGCANPVHLAANIDVRVGHRRPVERHMGIFACLEPGHSNLAFFGIGDGRPDTYTVTVPERPDGWEVRTQMPGVSAFDAELRTGVSAEIDHAKICNVIEVPREATAGSVVFGIARASCNQSTKVEFELVEARRRR